MAQWRKTFYSMGGPERIADPGAEEAARFGALLLQQRQQAEQAALQRQRMDMEQRQYADEGRRADQRMTLEQAARQQQASLAERGFGLDERRLAEQIRSGQAGEQRELSRDEWTRSQGMERLGLEREDLGMRRTDADRSYQQRERIAGEEGRRFDAGQRSAYDLAKLQIRAREQADQQAAKLQKEEGRLDRAFRTGEIVLRNQNDRQNAMDEAARRQAEVTQALGRQSEAEAKEAARAEATAVLQSLGGGPAEGGGVIPALDIQVPDPGFQDPNLIFQLPFGSTAPEDALALGKQLAEALARSGATTPKELERVRNAIGLQTTAAFEAAAREQQDGLFEVDNRGYQDRVLRLALAELLREYQTRSAAVSGTPGPQAPRGQRDYVAPARP